MNLIKWTANTVAVAMIISATALAVPADPVDASDAQPDQQTVRVTSETDVDVDTDYDTDTERERERDRDRDRDVSDREDHTLPARYDFRIAPGETMIFQNAVSFTGEVIAEGPSHRTVRAANDMVIIVPNQALVWNGETMMFNQDAKLGDRVVIHLRSEEPYRILDLNESETPMYAVGSYDGVFYMSEDFIKDLDIENHHPTIYADYTVDGADRIYHVDLISVEANEKELGALNSN